MRAARPMWFDGRPIRLAASLHMKTVSRTALFEDAWTRPLSRIAAEFGVSDTALRKMCDRHGIRAPGLALRRNRLMHPTSWM